MFKPKDGEHLLFPALYNNDNQKFFNNTFINIYDNKDKDPNKAKLVLFAVKLTDIKNYDSGLNTTFTFTSKDGIETDIIHTEELNYHNYTYTIADTNEQYGERVFKKQSRKRKSYRKSYRKRAGHKTHYR